MLCPCPEAGSFQELTRLSNGSGCDYGHDDKPKRAVERRAVPKKPKKGKGYESKKYVFIEIDNGESVGRSVVLVDHAARASRPRMGRWRRQPRRSDDSSRRRDFSGWRQRDWGYRACGRQYTG